MNEYDIVVVGGGAAGLSAALVLSRARRRVAVVDAGSPRNTPATHMHGFLGWDGAPPAALLKQGREEVSRYGGHLISGTVTDITAGDDSSRRFEVTLADGRSLRTRHVLVTTGLRDGLPDVPDVPGVRERGAATCCTARTATATRFARAAACPWHRHHRRPRRPASRRRRPAHRRRT